MTVPTPSTAQCRFKVNTSFIRLGSSGANTLWSAYPTCQSRRTIITRSPSEGKKQNPGISRSMEVTHPRRRIVNTCSPPLSNKEKLSMTVAESVIHS